MGWWSAWLSGGEARGRAVGPHARSDAGVQDKGQRGKGLSTFIDISENAIILSVVTAAQEMSILSTRQAFCFFRIELIDVEMGFAERMCLCSIKSCAETSRLVRLCMFWDEKGLS